MRKSAPILFAVILATTAATIYRSDPGAGGDLGLMPINAPRLGDVLSAAASGTVWSPITSIWSGTTGGVNVPLANTVYLPPGNTQNSLPNVDASGITRCPVTRATTLQNLFVVMNPGPGTGKTNSVTIMTNGAASSISVNIIGAATNGSDTTHSAAVPAGTEIGVRIITASGGASGKSAWSFEGR